MRPSTPGGGGGGSSSKPDAILHHRLRAMPHLARNLGLLSCITYWGVGVIILCWALVVFGVAIYLMYDFSDDDVTNEAQAQR